ncbi:pyrokinin-1 receptor-like [Dreissena polymorpha]|uniref:G-protein coupled receptors family 1 profile domain-containing protein n=1 Tax=Dreissena polymorpha TaxID=45954 RepID=A0A9D4D3U0_DREPO|nr:pyrokinin-1 receptor-like [Dreissena polymorpha]KAH3736803.1 hypothetical protein DPMN_043376 [Dreissena polymorpha]
MTDKLLNDSISDLDILRQSLGPRYQDTWSLVVLLTIYCVIFISGTVGNVCTCIVIIRNSYMQTATNYYIFSLAISDVLIIILALPPEAYSIYESYPWRFGEIFCYIKSLLQEMTSYASVLTITAFTVERYVAICHPLKAHKFASLSRSIKIIIAIWTLSLLCALPYPLRTELFYYTGGSNHSGTPLPESLICNIPEKYHPTMVYIFQLSTFLFFVFPLAIICVLYILIAISLRRAALQRVASQETKSNSATQVSQSGKSVFRMLIAVVVAFFTCWAPFHAQRLLTIYNKNWTPLLLHLQSALFYISGVLYFVGSIVNPILYNVMSKRYREAFKETICHCRRKRTLTLRNSSIHQSYYCSGKFSRPPGRSIVRRTDIPVKKLVRRSDTIQTQFSLSLNGNSEFEGVDPATELLLVVTTPLETPTEHEDHRELRKCWAATRHKTACCSACAADTVDPCSVHYCESHDLLNHSLSDESAC